MSEKYKRLAKSIGNILVPVKPFLVFIFTIESWIAKHWTASAHRRLYLATWGIPDYPTYFDHHIDLYYYWLKSRSPHWIERGVINSIALKRDGRMLEIACGDGFNTRNFYSILVKSVIACDLDVEAIRIARRKNSAPNIEYNLVDVRTSLPEGNFDNIVCDMALNHFTKQEINALLLSIKQRLNKNGGIFSGSTFSFIKEDVIDTPAMNNYELRNLSDLKLLLETYFENVIVFETHYPSLHNLYFWASDSEIPFSDRWKYSLLQKDLSR